VKRVLLTAVVLALAPACALVNRVVPSSAGDALNKAADGVALAKELEAKKAECDAFGARAVPYSEEVSIGGAIALALAKNTKTGVYVELSPDVAAAGPINPALAGKKVAPGKGERTDLNRYVNLVGKGLAAFSERPAIDWTFAVLDSDTPNAFSAPGGYVFITTGMLRKLDNEAQLAAVLGHEIGHVTGRHALEAYKKSKGTACWIAYGGGKVVGGAASAAANNVPFADEAIRALKATGGFNPDGLSGDFIRALADKAADGIVSVGFDKSFERDADATATKLMVLAGYDVGEFEKVLNKLPDGGGFFTPHPANKERIAVVQETRADLAGFSASKAHAVKAALK
jgi:beta-barrel assembly-enhancing protease